MDTESLKSLGWLLVWGALLFVMMRFGCGAHMMGGHGKHDKHRKSAADGETRDPCMRNGRHSGKSCGRIHAEGKHLLLLLQIMPRQVREDAGHEYHCRA